LDLGAGDGKFLISAIAAGANQAIRIEFAENKGHKLLFDALVQRLQNKYSICLPVEWIGCETNEVHSFNFIQSFVGLKQHTSFFLRDASNPLLDRCFKLHNHLIAYILFGLESR
jgi:hypothetical protein